MNTTIVTALYDINRKSQDHRTVEQYLEWFKKTLKLKVPMVIFVEEKFKSFVIENREAHNTKVIVTNHNEIPYFKYNSEIEEILNLKEYKEKILYPDRIECKLSMYNIIQYSKFEWLREVILNQYFDTDFYFWMDAGCSRFFEKFNIDQEWPQNYSILDVNKFNIQGNSNTVNYDLNWLGADNYIYEGNCFLVGTLFGGGKEISLKIANSVKDKFEFYLKKQIVNNEQIILGVIYQEEKSNFNVITYLNGQHLPFFSLLGTITKGIV